MRRKIPIRTRKKQRRRRFWRFLRLLYLQYTRDNCPLMAAAISFYALLSLIPLLLVGLSTFGYVLGSERALAAVSQFLNQFLPEKFGGATLQEYLAVNIVRPRGLVGILGLVSLLWTASMGFSTVTVALDSAWNTGKRRGFIATRLISLGMILAVGALVLFSFGITSTLKIIQNYHIPWSGMQPDQFPLVWQIVGWVIPATLSVLIFVLCYAVLPDERIGLRYALRGGLVAGALWEIAKQGFAVYLANFANYNKVYGSLGGLIILVMWIYYSAAILLLGGEVASISAEWDSPE